MEKSWPWIEHSRWDTDVEPWGLAPLKPSLAHPIHASGRWFSFLHALLGAMGIRTPDLLNAIEALYQLSYDPFKVSDLES